MDLLAEISFRSATQPLCNFRTKLITKIETFNAYCKDSGSGGWEVMQAPGRGGAVEWKH